MCVIVSSNGTQGRQLRISYFLVTDLRFLSLVLTFHKNLNPAPNNLGFLQQV